MSGTCVIGLQWGDEAKGKLVDLLAPQFDLVVRYQGGANAGHTVVAGDETYKLHHIPSGILHSKVQNLITPGVVINPATMLDEIDGLAKRGVICRENLRISERAHLVMPWHMAEDKFINATAVRGESIGTTIVASVLAIETRSVALTRFAWRTWCRRHAMIAFPPLPSRK